MTLDWSYNYHANNMYQQVAPTEIYVTPIICSQQSYIYICICILVYSMTFFNPLHAPLCWTADEPSEQSISTNFHARHYHHGGDGDEGNKKGQRSLEHYRLDSFSIFFVNSQSMTMIDYVIFLCKATKGRNLNRELSLVQ